MLPQQFLRLSDAWPRTVSCSDGRARSIAGAGLRTDSCFGGRAHSIAGAGTSTDVRPHSSSLGWSDAGPMADSC